jgi:hypothetical protein
MVFSGSEIPFFSSVTNSAEQNPWEDDSRSAVGEIPRFLRNPKFRYRFHKSQSDESSSHPYILVL